MTITLQPRLAYALMDQIRQDDETHNEQSLKPAVESKLGYSITEQEFLGHLDYMNQKGFLQVNFAGDAYANQGPNPLPATILVKDAQLTEAGESIFDKLEKEYRDKPIESPYSAIAPENIAFLEKVMISAGLPDIFDARDISEVVFRTMRDVMSNNATQEVANELHRPASGSRADKIKEEVADLWLDTNPIVRVISSLRPPLSIDEDLFLRRVRQEGGVPKTVSTEKVLAAIFAATKEELSSDAITEVGQFLPGQIKTLWQEAKISSDSDTVPVS